MTMIAISCEMNYFAYILLEQIEDAYYPKIPHHRTHVVRVLSLFSYSDQALRFLELIELPLPASSKKKG